MSSASKKSQTSVLQPFLDRLQERYNRPEYLSSDPLEFVHRYSDPWDQEAVALLSAVLAYGNVRQIKRSVEAALTRISGLSSSPAAFVRSLSQPASLAKADREFQGFVHRFNLGADLVLLFILLNKSWERFGSLGAHFLQHLDPQAEDFGDALSALICDWRSWIDQELASRKSETFGYLLTSPSDGSCCKRWCMLLRWMGRRDEVDPGLWTAASPMSRTFPRGRALRSSQLVIPLDTHTGRISQYLGLTSRKSLNWKAALEVTSSLKTAHEDDPVRYDFALARLGILDLCQRSYRKEICSACDLEKVCQFAKSGKKARGRA